MATKKIPLVQGDTRPQLVMSLTDERTGLPIDVSGVSTSIRFLFREVGADTAKVVLPCYPIAGYRDPETGEVSYASPYDVPGKGGRIAMNWSATALDTAGEFEAEVEVTFGDGGIQTPVKLMKFTIREQIGE